MNRNRSGISLLLVVITCMAFGLAHITSLRHAHAARPTTAPSESFVSIDNFNFKPRELTIAVGTKVTWVNKDDVPHTATSADDPAAFDSKTLDTDDKFSFTFTKAGTYKYFCKVHPHMTATVIVK